MAYDFNKEQETYKWIVDVNDRGDKICIRGIDTPRGSVVDIRRWYTDDTGELKPTSKGVRIADEQLMECLTALIVNLSEPEREELAAMVEKELDDGNYEDDTEDDTEDGTEDDD